LQGYPFLEKISTRSVEYGRMKFLCDVHISLRISKHIVQLGFESEHVNNILDGCNTKDSDIARFADMNKMILITKDRDFKNSFLLNQTPSRLIKVNLGNVSNKVLTQIFERNIEDIGRLYIASEKFMIEINQHGMLTVTK